METKLHVIAAFKKEFHKSSNSLFLKNVSKVSINEKLKLLMSSAVVTVLEVIYIGSANGTARQRLVKMLFEHGVDITHFN